MNYDDAYEQEIDLKDLFFMVLYRWRPIVLAAVVLGLILGGYKVAGGLKAQQDVSAVEKSREEYDKNLKVYERSLASYERDIESLQVSIENQEIYSKESILMKIDPYNKPQASADVLVKLAQEEWAAYPEINSLDPTDSLVRAYASSLIQRLDWEVLEQKTGADAIYLKELIGVSSDYSSNSFSISVNYLDEETALEILDEILKQVQGQRGELAAIVGEHSINVVNKNVGTTVDTGLADRQKQNSDKISNYQKNLTDKENALNDLEEPVLPTELSRRKVAMEGIKFAVIGGVGGAFLMAFYFCMIYVLNGKVHTEEEIKERFGVRILGVFALPVKKGFLCGIDHWLEKLEGTSERMTEEAVLDRAMVNIRNYAGGAEKLLVTGTVPAEKLREIADKLSKGMDGFCLTAGADMNRETATLQMLAGCDAVILVEQREYSKGQQIQKEREAIDGMKKPIIGCLVF